MGHGQHVDVTAAFSKKNTSISNGDKFTTEASEIADILGSDGQYDYAGPKNKKVTLVISGLKSDQTTIKNIKAIDQAIKTKASAAKADSNLSDILLDLQGSTLVHAAILDNQARFYYKLIDGKFISFYFLVKEKDHTLYLNDKDDNNNGQLLEKGLTVTWSKLVPANASEYNSYLDLKETTGVVNIKLA